MNIESHEQSSTKNKKNLFISKFDLSLRKGLEKCYINNIALYGAETLTVRKIEKKHLGRSKFGAGEGQIDG
jgi:hypothetical protein